MTETFLGKLELKCPIQTTGWNISFLSDDTQQFMAEISNIRSNVQLGKSLQLFLSSKIFQEPDKNNICKKQVVRREGGGWQNTVLSGSLSNIIYRNVNNTVIRWGRVSVATTGTFYDLV